MTAFTGAILACANRLRRPCLLRPFASASTPRAQTALIPSHEDTRVIIAARKVLKNHQTTSSSWSNHELIKRQKTLQPLKAAIEEWDRLFSLSCELRAISESDPDADMREIADAELASIHETAPNSFQMLKTALLEVIAPRPASYQQSALVEIKPGVGGVEAAHFATSLMTLYTRYATRKKWNIKPVSVEYMSSGQGQDGLREAVLEIEGQGAYGSMRWEAGVHRVQRVPVMQNTAAIHTSTAAVIVLPLNPSETQDDLEENLFDEKDIKLETMRSQGAGGQHVNKTESAVRLTHIPTGTVVSMQDSRSQHQNRARAYMILRARLLDLKIRQKQVEERGVRLSQVKTSNRSEKIRTYNFQQGRVTDHRIGLTLPRLSDIMEGGETLELVWTELDLVEQSGIIDHVLSNEPAQNPCENIS